MVALVEPDEEECYLLAILDSPDGIDLAEFAVHDARNPDGCYRLYDYQWPWFGCSETQQIEQGGRNTGKTESIKLRAIAFPFRHSGNKGMLLTAPELNHLRPLTDEVEKMLLGTRLVREMMPVGKGAGIARQPHWQVRFRNGTYLVSRLPNKDGKGVKGCVTAGSLILTKRGQIPIEDVQIGDEVLTHRLRWRRVENTYRFGAAPIVTVAGAGHRGLAMSETHSMYARRNRNPQRARRLEDPTWITPACEAAEGEPGRWYLGSPTEFPREKVPDLATTAMMSVAGAYVADGCVRRTPAGRLRGISITDDVDSISETLRGLRNCGCSPRIYEREGSRAVRVDADGEALAQFLLEHFGELAAGKKIPTWLLGADTSLRLAFLRAYLAGDGHYESRRKRWQASSASKALIIGLRLLAQSLGFTCGYSWIDPKITSICGAPLKDAPQRSHRLTITSSNRNAHREDGIAWQKVRTMTLGGEADTFDLTVEEDHSYIADGLISHNQHVVSLELDEAQDYPEAGWKEVVETLNRQDPDAMWRCHGVSRGVPDNFFRKTQPNSGWKVHRPMAMNRPSWGKEERNSKIVEYGGSRQAVDYRRNIYGEHGDATNRVFVLAKLMACVDTDEGSVYNTDVYSRTKIEFESFPTGASDDARAALLDSWIQIPGEHFNGYHQRVGNREVGSPMGYTAYWGGMDVGVTNHPSEILVFGQRTGTGFLELLTRIQMHRVNTDDQLLVVQRLFEIYGERLRFGIDKTGVGFPLWDQLTRKPYGDRIHGFGFAEKRVVALEDRPLQAGETMKDLAKLRNMVEASTDWLRNDYVDAKRLRLPYDREVLMEFQGQSYTVVRDNGDPYGMRRQFTGGSFHSLDAAKVAIATKHIPPLEALLEAKPSQGPVYDVFMGA